MTIGIPQPAATPMGAASVLTARLEPMYVVPCDGCTRCCHRDAVRLLAGDDLSQYQTEPHPYMPEARMLAHKPNGDCLYLGDDGCTIHDTKPQMCREMDCRRITQAITWTQARKMEARGALRMDIWRRGKELLRMGSNAEVRGRLPWPRSGYGSRSPRPTC